MQPKEEVKNSSKKNIEGIAFIPHSSSSEQVGQVTQSAETGSNTNKTSWSTICVILIILLLIFSAGYYYYMYMRKNKESLTLSEPLPYNPGLTVPIVPIAPIVPIVPTVPIIPTVPTVPN
jgi:heme/copper-type cytochrome/quinol oxidase subunit 2